MSKTNELGRVTRDAVVDELRSAIVGGEFPAGSKLPPRENLIERTGASRLTVQRGIDQLREEGFVRAHRGVGTFVTDNPPHQFHFGIVFSGHPEQDGQWDSRYRQVVHRESVALARETDPLQVHVFYDVSPDPPSESYEKLLDDVDANRLAGLIFPTAPEKFSDSPLLRSSNVTVVSFQSRRPWLPGVVAVGPDQNSFAERALERLADENIKSTAFFVTPGFLTQVDQEKVRYLIESADQYDIQCKPEWVQFVSPRVSFGVTTSMRLLMSSDYPECPEGVIVADDHLITPACRGLRDVGLTVGQDVQVIGYANFPDPNPPDPDVIRLGFNIRALLKEALNLMDNQRRGKTPPEMSLGRAVFEDELH
ncbi:MAG: GntR family transcriptional regulator [Planctomycetes bacterium]|nr:GntR family transcriptional regulator [Planctomycetota bacterium]